MRIVYYVSGWPPDRHPTGIVTATDAVARAVNRLGHQAEILSMRADPGATDARVVADERDDRGPRHLLNRVRRRFAPFDATFDFPARRIAAAINKDPALRRADIIEMEESFGWSRIVAGRVASPVVTRLHGPYFLTGDGAMGGEPSAFEIERIKREGAAIAQAPFVTAPSDFVLNATRDYYDCALDDAFVVPNVARPADAGDLWTIDGADWNEILFIGRFDRIKGADILLKAFAQAAAKRPDLNLTFAGPANGALAEAGRSYSRAEFIEAIMAPSIAARINFLGAVPKRRLAALRKRAAMTLIASRVETFSVTLVEALAQSAPVIATRVGAIPEIAAHGSEALLVPAEEPSTMAAAIERLLDDRAFAARLGAAGRRRVETEYAPEKVARRAIETYSHFIERAKAPTASARAGGF